jgi:DNA processing protein
VVAGGLDRPYPARHRALWRQVGAAGVLLSEAPLGTPNDAWRFPSRNRVLAAIADVVVVVESHPTGGSMITADEALKRGRTVLAVPGPIRSPASAGTNQLFRDGAGPACETADILAALALHHAGPMLLTPVAQAACASAPASSPASASVPLSPETVVVFEAVDWSPTSTQQVLARTGMSLGTVAAALARLEMGGRVRGLGGWWERISPPGAVHGGPTLDG